MIFFGAAIGAVLCFVNAGKSTSMLRLICIIVSIVGGLIFFVKYNDNNITRALGKFNLKYMAAGLYMIIAGWIVGLIGAVTNK